MSNRFNEHGLKMSRVIKLMPPNVYASKSCLSDGDLEDFLSLYGDDLPCRSTLNSELHCWYLKWTDDKKLSDECNTIVKALKQADSNFFPNLNTILRITCECERSISKLRLVKSMLRTTMVQERMNGLAMLHVHSDLQLDSGAIIDRFAIYRPRRMKLTNLLERDE